ncbi:MerR family transcriptional regulator [Evansella halocellulosilytica]|uniref:MerR family transcriptional regulator n=1 Tax=Evansella halocellulosilytica TaxID=2011013 RepID=UPI000BB9713C|nr:MerR family transcriptional regulator [Evansella halocellulosilytica]
MKQYWKVGELASLTGLTIRTLRYYDQIQLFSPSKYTESGHRLYTKSDLTILQQILSLKQIGMSLEDIKLIVKDKERNCAAEILATQIKRVKKEIQIQENLLNELEFAYKATHDKEKMSLEELTKLLSAMKMNQEKYFSKQQLDLMKKNYDHIDQERLEEDEKEFKFLVKQIREELEKGTSPENKKVQELAIQWSDIVYSYTKNDQEIQRQAEKFHAENPNNELQSGMDTKLYQYIMGALNRL